MTMKNAVFWDVALYRSYVNRLFGVAYRHHLQGREIREGGTSVSRWLQSADFSTLKTEAMYSSETPVHTRYTRRHIPDDGILHRTPVVLTPSLVAILPELSSLYWLHF
jgi:hypothetical protein